MNVHTKANSVEIIGTVRPNMTGCIVVNMDLSDMDAEHLTYTLWETWGDDWLFHLLRKEGYKCEKDKDSC